MVEAAASTGVDAVKFQVHFADAESSPFEKFRVPFSLVDKSRNDYWKRMEFTPDHWRGLKEHCESVGVDFMSSPFSCAAVDLLESINVTRYKIGSGEISNMLMLDRIVQTKKPIILSSGMSSYDELDATVAFLRKSNAKFSILQCTTKYPTEPEDLGLNVIPELRERYKCPVGFSDHSGSIFSAIAATALGAELIEAHLVFDKGMFGPDATSSLTVSEFTELVRGIRFIERAIKSPVDKKNNEYFASLKQIFEKSLAVNCDLLAGTTIELCHLESKKPAGKGHPASDYGALIGKKTVHTLNKGDFISLKDLYNG